MKVPAITKKVDPVRVEGDAQPERSAYLLDPYLTSDHKFITVIADNVVHAVESGMMGRKRRMKDRDRQNLREILTCILANLAKAAAEGIVPPAVAVSLKAAKRKRTRYDRPGFAGLPRAVELLAGIGDSLVLDRSSRKGTASRITAAPVLGQDLYRFKFKPEHFAIAEGREMIWLSRTTRDHVAGTDERELIDYRETEETRRYRAEMERINAALKETKMAVDSDDGPLIATTIRQLHRSFNLPPDAPEGTERFDLGGRLFGGWWMNLPKDRRHLIRINGEPVADLDFSSMFLRLAFLEAGELPPEGDLYAAIPGLQESRWRDGVKKTALAMLFRTTPLTRLPKDAKGLLPPRMSGSIAREAILSAFPALVPIYETGRGLGLMFKESQILIAALLDLANQKIPALPMHDGLMVPISKANAAARTMQDAAERIAGFRLPITFKATYA